MITITLQVDCQEEGTMLLSFYETIRKQNKSIVNKEEEASDFEKRMRSIRISDLIANHGLDVRAANCLTAEGLLDAYSIGMMFIKDAGRTLRTIPNLGKKSLKVIEQCLDSAGFFG